MLYLIPISLLAYKYRTYLGYYLMRTYSYLEIYYNRWYNKYYFNPDYKLFINGKQITDSNDIHRYSGDELGEQRIYTVEYIYKNKFYRVMGENLDKLLDYIENIDTHLNWDENKPIKVYKWISAEDDEGNCYLENVRKYAGSLGDFYIHAKDLIEVEYGYFYWLNGKKITLTDFRCDTFELDSSKKGEKVKLD